MRFCFVLSVVANVVLAGVLLWPSARPAAVIAQGDGSAKTVSAKIEAAASGKILGWEDSLTQFRQAGVPSAFLARLAIEKVAQKWTPLEKLHEQQYLNAEISAKQLAELHDQRAREEEQELRTALGDGYEAWDKQHTVDNMYLGGLTPTDAQRDSLYPLQKDYVKQLHDLEVARREGRLDEEALAFATARAELDYKSRLADIIGAERVDGLAGKEDPSREIRRNFARLQLTDAQMKALAGVQEKWTDARAEMVKALDQTRTMDVAYEGDLKAIDRARDDEFRRILGSEAFDAWQKSKDDRYGALKKKADLWKLSPQQIDSVYDAIRAYELAVSNIEYQAQVREHGGLAVDWAGVQSKVADYTRQTETALLQQLGPERLEALRKSEIIGLRPMPTAR